MKYEHLSAEDRALTLFFEKAAAEMLDRAAAEGIMPVRFCVGLQLFVAFCLVRCAKRGREIAAAEGFAESFLSYARQLRAKAERGELSEPSDEHQVH